MHYKIFQGCQNFLGLLILLIVLDRNNSSYAQPANDDCAFSMDISDGQWHAGNNSNASFNCASDINTSNCKSPYQTSDMCCGFDGTESSVFFNFTLPYSDVVNIDFRNIVCNPVNFFGVTTALQGFAFIQTSCVDVDHAQIQACFNASSAADINGQMTFNAVAGQFYQIMIDTKKNSLTSCGSGCIKASNCHSTCNWEIRIRPTTITLLKEFKLSEASSAIVASWYYDYEESYSHFRIKRKKLEDNTIETVSEGPVNNYLKSGYNFGFEDGTISSNGLYTYYLEGSKENLYFEPIVNKTIFAGFVDHIDAILSPNPASDVLQISVSNLQDGKASYQIYSSLGYLVGSGNIESQKQQSIVNTSLYPKGLYIVKVIAGNTVISKKLLLN